MPHLWPLLFPTWPQAQYCWRNWAHACTSFAKGAPAASNGHRIEVGNLQSHEVDIINLTRLGMDDVLDYIKNHQKNAKPFTGEKNNRSLPNT